MALFWRTRSRRSRRRGSKSITRQLLYGALIVGLVVACGYGVWYVASLPALTISDVTVSGGETISHDEVSKMVLQELEGGYFFLVPHTFTFLYPRDAIAERILKLPRVRAVQIEKIDWKMLSVSVEEYIPRALWCEDTDAIFESCVFLSEDGYAFAKAPPLQGSVFLRHVFEDRTPETGVRILSAEDMERIRTLVAALKTELGFRTYMVIHTSVGDETYYLAGGGKLIVSAREPVQATFDNLRSILEAEEFAHLAPGNFNYIDLRFGNRVFVKEEMDAPPSDAATTTDERVPAEE